MRAELPPGWSCRRLDQLGFVGRGRSRHRPRNDPSLYGGPYPFFQTGDVRAAELYLSRHSQTYNQEGLAQSKLWQPGTLCITIAANIAESAILAVEGCFPDSIVGFVADPEEADVRFVKYAIDTMKLQMQSISRGTTQDNLSLDKLLTFGIPVPSLPTQRKIAAILSAYGDLIENNARRIAILEEMAQLLYREWFVHFRFPGHEDMEMLDSELGVIPQGWEVVRLCEVATVNRASLGKSDNPDEINYVTIGSVTEGSVENVETIPYKEAPSRAQRIVKHGDIIWTKVRPNLKSYALILDPVPNMIVSTGFAVITPRQLPYTYLYHALTTERFVDYLTKLATGAAYPAVRVKDFKDAKVLRPTEGVLEPFHRFVANLHAEREILHQKNEVLRLTRDLLLPRLVSGELDVSSLDVSTGGSL
jgi:type I restriction enzyme S subunit